METWLIILVGVAVSLILGMLWAEPPRVRPLKY